MLPVAHHTSGGGEAIERSFARSGHPWRCPDAENPEHAVKMLIALLCGEPR